MRVLWSARRWRSWQGVLGAAVVVAVLAGAGVGIAAEFGTFNARPAVFNGLSAAQHTRTGADALPPTVLAAIKRMNAGAERRNGGLWRPATARLLGKTSAATVYALSDTRGHLCYYDVLGLGSGGGGCVRPLSRSQPITLDVSNEWTAKTGSILTVVGLAIDGVTSVSFTVARKDVTVPVNDNVYTLKRRSAASTVQCAVAHFGAGPAVKLIGYPSCPSVRSGVETSTGGSG